MQYIYGGTSGAAAWQSVFSDVPCSFRHIGVTERSPAYTGASHFEADYPFSDVNEIFDTECLAEFPGVLQAATNLSLSSQSRFKKPPSKARAATRANPKPRTRRPNLNSNSNTAATAALYDSSDEDFMQGGHELEYVGTLEREIFSSCRLWAAGPHGPAYGPWASPADSKPLGKWSWTKSDSLINWILDRSVT